MPVLLLSIFEYQYIHMLQNVIRATANHPELPIPATFIEWQHVHYLVENNLPPSLGQFSIPTYSHLKCLHIYLRFPRSEIFEFSVCTLENKIALQGVGKHHRVELHKTKAKCEITLLIPTLMALLIVGTCIKKLEAGTISLTFCHAPKQPVVRIIHRLSIPMVERSHDILVLDEGFSVRRGVVSSYDGCLWKLWES